MKLGSLPIKDMRLDDIAGGSLFGMRRHPRTKKWSMHNGIDRSCGVGTPLLAVFDGVVEVSKRQKGGYGLGEYIVIKNGDHYALYAHLSQRIVIDRQRVKAGQIIGQSGNTGESTGPHLHFGICTNYNAASVNKSNWIDPMPLLKAVKEGNEDTMKRYNKVRELPRELQREARVLVDSGALAGDGNGNLDVTEDMVRTMIVSKRYTDKSRK